MANENTEGLYLYPVEELDKIIDQINNGIMPMMNDQLKKEVDLRYKEISGALFNDDEENIDVVKQQALVKKAIEKKKREASKKDVLIITLNEDQKKELRNDMSSSFVRKDPNNRYNLPDEQLYSSEEKKVIETKLARLKNCYYNQKDYVNAIHIIQEAIQYSLKNDYPWMSEEEACEAFNKGEIKFTWGNLPKLYINYSTQITDKEILKGVVTGQVILKDRYAEEDNIKTKKKRVDSNPVSVPYNIINKTMYDDMAKLHAAGYDTPMSLAFKAKSTIYNRFALPYGTDFNNDNKNEEKCIDFDWTREGAGEEYFNLMHGIKSSTNDIIRYVNNQNNKSLNNIITQNAIEFLHSMKYSDGSSSGFYSDNGYVRNNNQPAYVPNPRAVEVEKNILNAIRANNPTP